MNIEGSLLHQDLTEKILIAFYKNVYPKMGYGFLEKVYENAMVIALSHEGLEVRAQEKIDVFFQGQLVGEYFADLLVNGFVIVEIKVASPITKQHEAQLLNYLRATPYEVGLLFNFGPKPGHLRKVYSISRKTITWEKVNH